MAILKVLKYGDNKLRQETRNVTKFSKKILKLIDDMFDTMYANNGVGLAATQVGENFRIFVIDIADKDEHPCPMVFVNPVIIKKMGAMNSLEGCLSFPNVNTYVKRYSSVLIKAQDIDGRHFTLESPPDSLLSKALQHEYDHLEGILFVDHARDIELTNKLLNEQKFKAIETDRIIEEAELEKNIETKLKLQVEE